MNLSGNRASDGISAFNPQPFSISQSNVQYLSLKEIKGSTAEFSQPSFEKFD
jgi:hypothetical protein